MAGSVTLDKPSPLARVELNPAQTIVAGFAAIILVGALLLSLPVLTTLVMLILLLLYLLELTISVMLMFLPSSLE